jgi:hypothetical protein
MLSRILPKHTLKSARCFAATSEIADFAPLRVRNFISHEDYKDVFNAVIGADSVNDMANFLRAAEGALDDRMLSYSW